MTSRRAMEPVSTAVEDALARAERGDLAGLAEARAALAPGPGPGTAALRLGLEAAMALHGREGRPPPEAPAGLEEVPARARAVAVRGCLDAIRASALGFDEAAAAGWLGRAERLGGSDPAEALAVRAGRLWLAVLRGDGGAIGLAQALFEEAARQRQALLVVELAALRALLTAAVGAPAEAVEIARRASRMAQAEGLPFGEVLASTVLARLRRQAGRPHLAMHILNAVARVAPPRWSPWLAWESVLAGGEERAAALLGAAGEAPAAVAAAGLLAALRAARSGDRAGFDRAAREAPAAAAGFREAAREAEALLAALDPARPPPSAEMAAWLRGEAPDAPYGVHGVGSGQELGAEAEGRLAYVVAAPGQPGRRVLRPGLPLAGAARALEHEGPSGQMGARTDTGVAALALAGPAGLPRPEFFRTVYGFPFVFDVHRGVLDVLVHRMRVRLGPAGEIERTAEPPALALALREPVTIPDGRCVLPVLDRVLRAVAALGTASAQEAAGALRMPVRTVQTALQQLVGDGACRIVRAGRRVVYRVQDTTFSQITALPTEAPA